MTDDEFLAAFEAGVIPKAKWTHAAHVRMGWLYLRRLSFGQALVRIRDGIRRHNAAVGGSPTFYHETITVAYTRLVHDRLRTALPGEDFAAFRSSNPDLFERSAAVLSRYYAPKRSSPRPPARGSSNPTCSRSLSLTPTPSVAPRHHRRVSSREWNRTRPGTQSCTKPGTALSGSTGRR